MSSVKWDKYFGAVVNGWNHWPVAESNNNNQQIKSRPQKIRRDPLGLFEAVIPVFQRLGGQDRRNAARTCKAWLAFYFDPKVYQRGETADNNNNRSAFIPFSSLLLIRLKLIPALNAYSRNLDDSATAVGDVKDLISRTTEVVLEEQYPVVCSLVFTNTDSFSSEIASSRAVRLSPELSKTLCNTPPLDLETLTKAVAKEIFNLLATPQVRIELPEAYQDRLKVLLKNPSKEFEDWKKRSQITDIFQVGQGYFYLNGKDPAAFDQMGFQRLIARRGEMGTIKVSEEDRKTAKALGEFLWSCNVEGESLVLRGGKRGDVFFRANRALVGLKEPIQVSEASLELLIKRSLESGEWMFDYLILTQAKTPQIIGLLYFVINSQGEKLQALGNIEPLRAWLGECMKNQGVLRSFLEGIIIKDRGILDEMPKGEDPILWADKQLNGFEKENVGIKQTNIENIFNRLNDTNNTKMWFYLKQFKKSAPNLWALLSGISERYASPNVFK